MPSPDSNEAELAISSARGERSKNGLRLLAAEAYYLAGQTERSLRLLLKVKPDLLRSSSRDLFERFKADLFRIIRNRHGITGGSR